jgi:hypothetical protein
MRASHYQTAEVCVNGHATTSAIERSPELTAKFCPSCGAETIRKCPSCSAPIRGYYDIPGIFDLAEYHCYNCGTAFPWTQAKLEAAKEHAADLEGLDEREKAQLQAAIDDLAARGARTEIAASRFKQLMKKAGQTVGGGLYKVVLDVASEAAKKLIVGG